MVMGSDDTGDGSFENPFATIGHAMANMSNNDWIIVTPGVYEENLVAYEMSGLLVAIAGPDSTFISGSGQNRIMEIDYGNWMIGGGEELHWTLSILFDAMGALSSKYNDNPKIASRAYDSNRDGFVISGGGENSKRL